MFVDFTFVWCQVRGRFTMPGASMNKMRSALPMKRDREGCSVRAGERASFASSVSRTDQEALERVHSAPQQPRAAAAAQIPPRAVPYQPAPLVGARLPPIIGRMGAPQRAAHVVAAAPHAAAQPATMQAASRAASAAAQAASAQGATEQALAAAQAAARAAALATAAAALQRAAEHERAAAQQTPHRSRVRPPGSDESGPDSDGDEPMGAPNDAGPQAAAMGRTMHRHLQTALTRNSLEISPLRKPKRGNGYFPRVLETFAQKDGGPPMVLRTKGLPGSTGDADRQARAQRVQDEMEKFKQKKKPLQLRPNPLQLEHGVAFAIEHGLTKAATAAEAAGRRCYACGTLFA